MSTITVPTNPLNSIFNGDMDILVPTNSDFGTGTIHIRNGGLYVEGLTDLDETTINTTDGIFTVVGTNKIDFNISGGSTSSIEMTAEDASFWTTTTGTLALSATATDANGKISINAAGTGTDSILLDATNTTSGQITIQSASEDVSSDSIRLLATGTTGGNIAIVGSGSTDPAVLIDATSTSGKIQIQSSGDASGENSIEFLASGTTDGNVLISAAGTDTNNPSIKLLASNTTSGQILIEADGNVADAIRILANNATNGGIDIDAIGGTITIDTTNTTTGISIATNTAGVPVLIGTSTSLTTIAGDLIVQGTTTTFNTETLTVEDNIILLNAGNGELDIDSGILVRRYQTPNDLGTGNVITSNTPTQESGAFQAGASTPATLVLEEFASGTDDFYNGWWIHITSGTGNNQVRRIKDYVGSTKTATLYITADNTTHVDGPAFTDGLDLATAPAAADTYSLFNNTHIASYFNEAEDAWVFSNVATVVDPISSVGASTVSIQNYQEMHMGAVDVHPQIYKNVNGSAAATVITFTILSHSISIGDKITIADSSAFTPTLTAGTYVVQTVPTVDTFTITATASTTSTSASSATVSLLNTSKISVNVIEPHDSSFGGISIPGLSCVEDIIITKTSTADFTVSVCTTTYGALIILVSDLNNTDGAFSAFAGAKSTATGAGSVSRLVAAKGADGQRINAKWANASDLAIFQQPAGSGAGTYTYRVRVFSAI